MIRGKYSLTLAAALAAVVVNAALAGAQCSNISGNPAPTAEPLLTQKVALNDGPGVGWGGGDERYKLVKGIFTTVTPFDPITTDNVTFTFHVNTVGGAPIGSTTVFAGDPLWTTPQPGRWIYNDNATPWPFGVRRIDIRDLGANQYLIRQVRGQDVNLGNMPLGPADNLHVMLEVWDALNAGICVDSTLTNCNGAGTTCRP